MFQSDDFDDLISDETFAIIENNLKQNQCSAINKNNCTLPLNDNQIINGKPQSKKVDDHQEILSCRKSVHYPSNTGNESETPNKGKRKRKFPGPAGLLPDKFVENANEKFGNVPLSQSFPNSQNLVSNTVFEEYPWRLMLSEMRGVQQCSIRSVKQKALEHRLAERKVPVLAGVVQSVDRTLPDPLLVLRDTTDEIQCTLHRDAWESLSCHLVPHFAVVVLKNATIFSTGTALKKIYLNITNNNVMSVYCDQDNVYSANPNIVKSSKLDLSRSYSEKVITNHDNRVVVLRNINLDKSSEMMTGSKNSNSLIKTPLINAQISNDILAETLLDGIADEFISQDFE